jgi:predicted sugar kinase
VPAAAGEALASLGLTLKYPVTQLRAQKYERGLSVVGPRANLGYQQAERFLARRRETPRAEIEIEWTAPNYMGLGSEPILGLSLARALAWTNDAPLDDTPTLATDLGLGPEQAAAVWGFHRGGLLLVEAQAGPGAWPPVLRRASIAHDDIDQDWAFVLFLPGEVAPLPEAERLAALWQAAPHLSAETGRTVIETMWPAVERDDVASFARGLMRLDQLNREALAQAGTPGTVAPQAQEILELMRERGALAYGQSLTGQALFALVRGAPASRALRQAITAHVTHFGGSVLGAITDNAGAQHQVKEEKLEDDRLKPIKMASPESSS